MSGYGYPQDAPPPGYTYDEYGRLVRLEPRAPAVPASGPNYRWWIPAEGIRRDVIQADLQRYLGPDSHVRPGEGRDENRGQPGYWIAAYRTFTAEMIRDLKADSANFERSGDRGPYQDSTIHRSRQHWGPTQPQQPEPDRQPSRASDSTTYSGTTSSSYQNSTGYSGGYSQTPQSYSSNAQPTTSHYTYQAPDPNTTSHYSYPTPESGYAPNRTSDHDALPRTHASNAQGYSPQNASSQSYGTASHRSSTRNAPPAAPPAAPPGYYLASDGNYYPNASRPA